MVQQNQATSVQAGQFIFSAASLNELIIGLHGGKPVYLSDVATLIQGPEQPERYVWLGVGPAGVDKGIETSGEYDAVTIAIAKQPGHNAADIAQDVLMQVEALRGVIVPGALNVTVTRVR